jgi:phage terminase large subunit-like protein
MRVPGSINEARIVFEALKDLSDAERREHLRVLYRADLYCLLRYGMNRWDLEHPWLFDRCREVQAKPYGVLHLWARDHRKTSIISVGLTVFDLLRDPESTAGILSHTRTAAESILRTIKRELESNEHLKWVFDDVLFENPQKQSPKWSEFDGLIVKRTTNKKEASVEAWGLDAQPIGKHFDHLIYDDIVTALTTNTPEMIVKTTDNWRLSTNLGTADGTRRICGTRYHFTDTYAEIIKSGVFDVRQYPCTVDGTEDFSPENCVLLPPEKLIEKRREQGAWTFSCQMLLRPQGDTSSGFRREWVRHMDGQPHGRGLNIYITVDPAHSKKKGSDYTVMAVVGIGADGVYRLLDIVRDRMNLGERTKALFDLVRKWRPIRVGYERYGAQGDFQHIKGEQHARNVDFRMVELGGTLSKADRIRKLIPLFEQGRFILPPSLNYTGYDGKTLDLIHVLVEHELLQFPVSQHDDMMDAIARVLDDDLKAKPAEGGVSWNGGRQPRVVMSRSFMSQHPHHRSITGTRPLAHMTPGADGGSRSISAADAPMPDDPVRTPPGYTQDRWEDMPEERSDFFATRRRQPRVIAGSSTYPVGSRPPRRPGSNS